MIQAPELPCTEKYKDKENKEYRKLMMTTRATTEDVNMVAAGTP
jgi:hypothetical protein